MTRPLAHTQLDGSVPPERYERDAIRRHDHAHGYIRYAIGICLPALELKMAVITRQETGKCNEHLAQRRVNVEIELAFEVVRPKLAKVGLVPDHHVREPDFMKARPAGEEGIYRRWNMFRVLLDEFGLAVVVRQSTWRCCGDKPIGGGDVRWTLAAVNTV